MATQSAGSFRPAARSIAAAAIGGSGLLAVPVAIAVWLAVPPATVDRAERISEPKMVGERTVTAVPVDGIATDTLATLFDKAAYDIAAIANEKRRVPPIFVRTMPTDWTNLDGGKRRKTLFEKIVLPLILKANAEIRADRRKLLDLMRASDTKDGADLPAPQQQWLAALAKQYKLKEPEFAALKRRVDVVPVDVALAQAANESGWGTSRFARQGNALFGQWTWDASEAMAPKSRQKGKGNYGVKKFPTLGASVAGYMRNLNTHSAYAPFRRRRAAQRASGRDVLHGPALVAGLKAYSQRGQAYVDEIRGMIEHNAYAALADARLAATPPSVTAAAGL